MKDLESELWAVAALVDVGSLAGEPDLARDAIERAFRLSEPMGTTSILLVHSRLGADARSHHRADQGGHR